MDGLAAMLFGAIGGGVHEGADAMSARRMPAVRTRKSRKRRIAPDSVAVYFPAFPAFPALGFEASRGLTAQRLGGRPRDGVEK